MSAPTGDLCEACDEPIVDRFGEPHRCFRYTCAYCEERTDNADLLCDACDDDPYRLPWCP